MAKSEAAGYLAQTDKVNCPHLSKGASHCREGTRVRNRLARPNNRRKQCLIRSINFFSPLTESDGGGLLVDGNWTAPARRLRSDGFRLGSALNRISRALAGGTGGSSTGKAEQAAAEDEEAEEAPTGASFSPTMTWLRSLPSQSWLPSHSPEHRHRPLSPEAMLSVLV